MTAPLPAYVPPKGSCRSNDLGINDDLVLYVAADCRNFVSKPPVFVPDEPAPYFGGHFAYWPVVFPDGVRVMVKAPLSVPREEDKTHLMRMMKAEIELLETLEKGGFPWSPRLLYHTMDDDNPLGRPYMIHTLFPGKRMQWSDTFPAEKADREKVLAQIARMNFDLLLFDRRHKAWESPPKKWVEDRVDIKIFRSLHGLDDHLGLNERKTLYLRILARTLTQGMEHGSMESKVFALSHENLFSHNIYIDENLKVTGFIAWEWAKSMPFRFAMRFPWFLNIIGKQQPQRLPSDPKEFSQEFLKIPTLMKADRNLYISRVQFEFATRETRHSIGHLSPQAWEIMCWDHDNVDWKHIILDAVLNRQPHMFLAAHNFLVGCLPESPGGRIEEVISQRDLYSEVWDFFCKHVPRHGTNQRAQMFAPLLYQALCREQAWNIVEARLRQALGRPRPQA